MSKKTIIKSKGLRLVFTPLRDLVRKRLRDERYKKSYFEELNRLRLASDLTVLRKKKGMTQQQVAEKTCMSQSVIARIESGANGFSIRTLSKIAHALDREVGLVAPRK